ncbi:MAG TPA: asparaginase [Candidatus Limnocylindrales bacterium]
MPRVAIVFTGGTISMRPDPAAGGNVPTLDGKAILDLAPQVAAIAEVEVIDWGMVPASHLRFAQILSIARIAAEQLARPEIDGLVIVQGTDVIEETAFAYDMLLTTDKPVLVTGAMRDSSATDYDGPRNLADAVRCAVSAELRGTGVSVVLDGLVVGADQVVKTDTTALDTFQPREGEPMARVVNGCVVIESRRTRRPTLPAIPDEAVDDIQLVTAVVGMDGSIVRGLSHSHPRGLVVAATGSGNTSADLLAAATELMADGTTVVLTTRCAKGVVAPLYAFPGGGATWQRAGAILSAFDGPKSRVALALGLAARLDRAGLVALLGQ